MKRREFLKLAALSPLGFLIPSWMNPRKGLVSWRYIPTRAILNEEWIGQYKPVPKSKLIKFRRYKALS